MIDHKTCKITKNPTKRTAHFIKPCLKQNALPPKLPKIQSFSISAKPKVWFLCHSTPLTGWKIWVEKLEPTHQAAWRKAGIFDAIKCSTCHIGKVSDLIYSLDEKWCPKTNTFVFPWGEATVTLEDVYVLGGFSPLGAPVTTNNCSILDENEKRVQEMLLESSQVKWLEHFMGIGNRLEYAGFLALWLSRHVFVSSNNSSVTHSVFAMAARISCGAKLALGPAILASIYRDLTLLKRESVDSLSGRCRSGSPLKVSALLQLVQVWAWERFPSLGPVPRMINEGESRLTRWESDAWKFCKGIEFIKTCLDSARETFIWRPYNISIENWSLPRFYVDSGMWVVADSHEKWRLFARCFMVGQLDGLDFVERYNPHRVALQFGFDQDIPESVDGSEASFTLGEVKRLKLYLPSRLQEGDVTYRYFDWWRTMMNVNDEGRVVGCKRMRTTRERVKKRAKICGGSNEREAIGVAKNVKEKPLEKSPPIEVLCGRRDERETIGVVKNVEEKPLEKSPPREELSSENVLQAGDDINMACVFHVEVGSSSQEVTCMEEDMENEVWVNNNSVGEGSKNSDHNNFQNEKENEINISCSKLSEVEPIRSVDQEDANMKPSEMLLERQTSCDAMNSLCSQVAAEIQNLGYEVGQVKVTSPLIVPEEGSRKCEDSAREHNTEQNLIEHNVKMDKSLECLEADISQIKTPPPTESNGILMTVACEDEQAYAFCQAPEPDTNHGNIIPVDGQVTIIDVEDNCDPNTFVAFCLNYESRIRRLEEIFGVSA